MGAIFSYSLTSGIILILAYIAYKIVMADEKQFAMNRLAIYLIYATALLLPAAYPEIKALFNSVHEVKASVEIEPGFATFPILTATEETPRWIRIILAVYFTGVIIASARLALCVARIFLLARRKECHRLSNGYTLVITDDRVFSPFSFFHFIVISREDYERSSEEILIHETTHLRKLHWIDQITGNLVAIFTWYNPASWLLIEELKSIHEYQADAAVIASGTDMRHYQYLLIEKAVGKRFPSPANSLNHSKLKKRVTMMYKSKSTPMRRMAAIMVMPAAVAAMLITDIPAVAEVISETRSASLRSDSDGKVTNFFVDSQISENPQAEVAGDAKPSGANVIAVGSFKKDDATDPSYEVNLMEGVDVVAYGSAPKTELKNNDENADPQQLTVYTLHGIDKPNSDMKASDSFTVYVDGVEIPHSDMEKINPSTIESIEVNKQDSKIRITLKKASEESKTKTTSQTAEKKPTYKTVEQFPEFPGGMDNMMAFMANNLRYPQEAYDKNIEGKVAVRFMVTADGKVTNATVLKSVEASLDAEALRVVSAMPEWVPGRVDGKPVDCYFTIPVNFRLESKKDREVKAE